MQSIRPIDDTLNTEKSNLSDDTESSPIRIGLFFSKIPSVLIGKPPLSLFRGDASNFNHVFNNGFKARGKNFNIVSHSLPHETGHGTWYAHDSAYISTSVSKEIAASFPHTLPSYTKFTYVYEIHMLRPVVNLAQELVPMLTQGLIDANSFKICLEEKERAVPLKVKPSEVIGGWKVEINNVEILSPEIQAFIEEQPIDCQEKLKAFFKEKNYTRTIQPQFIPNPNYIPPVHPQESVWKAGRSLGYILTGVGITLDTMSLYRQYQISKETDDYDNTYREGVRIIGGWTGAMTTGAIFTKFGVMACSPLTPVGSAACGVVGGIVGSTLGYYLGSNVLTQIYDVKRSINHILLVREAELSNMLVYLPHKNASPPPSNTEASASKQELLKNLSFFSKPSEKYSSESSLRDYLKREGELGHISSNEVGKAEVCQGIKVIDSMPKTHNSRCEKAPPSTFTNGPVRTVYFSDSNQRNGYIPGFFPIVMCEQPRPVRSHSRSDYSGCHDWDGPVRHDGGGSREAWKNTEGLVIWMGSNPDGPNCTYNGEPCSSDSGYSSFSSDQSRCWTGRKW